MLSLKRTHTQRKTLGEHDSAMEELQSYERLGRVEDDVGG
jgi:hypothetical protein